MDSIILSAGLAAGLLVSLLLWRLRIGPGAAFALVALGMAWISSMGSGGDTQTSRPPGLLDSLPELASLLLIPILYWCGQQLSLRLRWRFTLAALLQALLRVVVGTFLLGGFAYLWIPWPEPLLSGSRFLWAFLVGAALSLPDPFLRLTNKRSLDPPESDQQSQGAWAVVLGLLTVTALYYSWPRVGSDGGPFLDRFVGIAAAVAGTAAAGGLAGLFGAAIRIATSAAFLEVLVDLATAYTAYLVAQALPGSALVAVFVASVVRTSLQRSRWSEATQGGDLRSPVWDLLVAVGGLVIFIGTGAVFSTLLDLKLVVTSAALWVMSILIQFILLTTLEGSRRRVPPNRSRWLSILSMAWGHYPGLLAVGAIVALDLIPEAEGLFLSRPKLPGEAFAVFLQVTLLALLSQGATAARVFERCTAAPSKDWDRWQELEGVRLALQASLNELTHLEQRDLVSEVPAKALRATLTQELRRVELERLDRVTTTPDIERQRWTLALRTVLLKAREAIGEACASGQISPAAASRLEKVFLEKWQRASEVSIGEALGKEKP